MNPPKTQTQPFKRIPSSDEDYEHDNNTNSKRKEIRIDNEANNTHEYNTGTQRKVNYPRYYQICGTDEEKPMSRVSPMKGNLILRGLIGTVEKVHRLFNGDLIVGVKNSAQEKNILAMTLFDTAPVRVTLHRSMNHKKGVIRCSALRDIPETEIVEGLSAEGVTEARKIYFTKEGKTIPSATVILTFECSTLPREIKAGYLNVKVDAYVPNPLRCFQCFRYGHPKDKCKRKSICARCGKEDHTDDRECRLEPHCINCSGGHSAFSKDCPKFIEEKEIQRIRVTENLSFFEARQRIRPAPLPGTNYASVVKKTVATIGTQTEDKYFSEQVQPQTPSTVRTPRSSSSGKTSQPSTKATVNSTWSTVRTNRLSRRDQAPKSNRLSKAEKQHFKANFYNSLPGDDSVEEEEEMVLAESPRRSKGPPPLVKSPIKPPS